MLSKNVFKILFFLSGAVALYMGANFFIDLHRYFQLSLDVNAQFENWDVEEVRSGKYIVTASYAYQVDGATYHQKTRMAKTVYPNKYLAKEHIEKWKDSQNWVWVNPKNPHQSGLFRPFPLKKGIHLLLAVGILFYFLWLNIYVRRVHPDITESPASK